MTICPIALLVGCKKCPAFSFCPLTTVLGDQEKREEGSSRRADLYNQIKKEKATTDEESKDVSSMTLAHDRDDKCEDKSLEADDHLDKMDDLEKNKTEEPRKE